MHRTSQSAGISQRETTYVVPFVESRVTGLQAESAFMYLLRAYRVPGTVLGIGSRRSQKLALRNREKRVKLKSLSHFTPGISSFSKPPSF